MDAHASGGVRTRGRWAVRGTRQLRDADAIGAGRARALPPWRADEGVGRAQQIETLLRIRDDTGQLGLRMMGGDMLQPPSLRAGYRR